MAKTVVTHGSPDPGPHVRPRERKCETRPDVTRYNAIKVKKQFVTPFVMYYIKDLSSRYSIWMSLLP